MKAYKILKLGEWVVVQEAYTNKKGKTTIASQISF
jgi:hypothetical protein